MEFARILNLNENVVYSILKRLNREDYDINMKILVAVVDYPNLKGEKSLYFVHVRNLVYQKSDIEVTVLNFSSECEYLIDGISVITKDDFIKNRKNIKYDALVSHAPNLRNHFKFLVKYGVDFERKFFFFHGHEILKVSRYWPTPFYFQSPKKRFIYHVRLPYDVLKLFVWRRYFKKNISDIYFVFVSEWLMKQFEENVKVGAEVMDGRSIVIHNGVGKIFEEREYITDKERLYDFICIRGGAVDNSIYCIDMVLKIAEVNPGKKFLICGKGKIFDYMKVPQNVQVLDEILEHDEIMMLLNDSKCALLPTRMDTQGVMACEVATFGIPLITSNIPICQEIFRGFGNVKMIDNDNYKVDLSILLDELTKGVPYEKNEKYFKVNTSCKEMALLTKQIK